MLFQLYCTGPYGGSYPVQEHDLRAWIKPAGILLLLARFLRVAVLVVLCWLCCDAAGVRFFLLTTLLGPTQRV